MRALSQAFLEGGVIKGKRDALRRILHRRFGTLSEMLERGMDAADSTHLDDLINRAATADSLNEV